MEAVTETETHDCSGCTLKSRRDFLREAGIGAAALFASIGIAQPAAAMLAKLPTTLVDPIRSSGKLRVYQVPLGDGVQIDKENQVILTRWQGRVYAFNLSCPHQNTALKWDNSAHRFQCPKHHSQYEPDGRFIEGRATRGMDRLAITRDAAGVSVNLDKMYQQDTDPSGWAAAVVSIG